MIGVQNPLSTTLCSSYMCNKILKARNSTHTHTNFKPLISLVHIKFEQNIILK